MYKAMIKDFLEIIQAAAISLHDEPVEMVEGYEIQKYDKDTQKYKMEFLEGTFITSVAWIGDEVEYIRVPDNCTKTDYMKICKFIMSIVFNDPIHSCKQDFYNFRLESYINDFARKVKTEWKCFQGVSLESLPIRITTDNARTVDGDYNGQTQGTCDRYSGMITLYNVVFDYDLKEEHKLNARHEVLHYMLFAARLNGFDDSPVFHFFCRVYDAGAYMALTEENQKIYDSLCSIYDDGKKEEIDEAFCKIIENNRAEKTDETAGNND